METQNFAQLPEIQRLSSRVMRVLGGNPGKFTLQGTNTYIVGTGSKRILIDTGEGRPAWINAIQKVLFRENALLDASIITHGHMDHVGGVGQLLEVYPNTTIYKHQPIQGQLDIVSGQIFQVEGVTLRALHCPGHTTDHTAFILEEEGSMFTGDNILGHGTSVFEDLPTYLKSLEMMKGIFSGRAYPGHGPVIEDGKARILEYIQHRKEREDQVLDVLSRSPGHEDGWASTDIVKIVYKDVPENLHGPANSGVIQVLRKLQREERVVEEPSRQRWRLNRVV